MHNTVLAQLKFKFERRKQTARDGVKVWTEQKLYTQPNRNTKLKKTSQNEEEFCG